MPLLSVQVMFRVLSLVAAVLAAATATHAAGVSYAPLSDSELEAAFVVDGFKPVRWVHYNSRRGLMVESVNATTRSNGQHKPTYYVEGNGYEQGYLMGLMAENATAIMCTTYLKHVVPQLIDAALDRLLSNSTVYEEFLVLLDAYLIEGTVHSFERQSDSGVFPESAVQEMHGLVDGCTEANEQTPVTWERVVTLNFGFDFVLAAVYSGTIWPALTEYARLKASAGGADGMKCSSELLEFLELHAPNAHQLLKAPVIFCDAFGVSGNATRSGDDVFMARDFQLATADVFQDLAALVISFPIDEDTTDATRARRYPLVSAMAPGFVGSLVAMNSHGVAMGVDVARGAAVNASWPGLDSILLIRATIDVSTNFAEAAEFVASAQRGVTYLYPLCDAAGVCGIIEASKSTPGADSMNPLHYANFPGLGELLPTQSFIDSHVSTPFRNGVFVRMNDYVYPEAYLEFNSGLFNHSHFPYNASSFADPVGFVYADWQIEKPATLLLGANFFPPQREQFKDVVICSNTALVPDMRMNQMSVLPYLLLQGSNGLHWRYDSMNSLLTHAHGDLTFEGVRSIITFLAPDRAIGYWTNPPLDPSDPMTQEVEGVIAVMDLKRLRYELKAGYWCDDWIGVNLDRYYKTTTADSGDL